CELQQGELSINQSFLGLQVKPRVAGRVHTLTVRDVKLSEAGEVKVTAKDFLTQAQLFVGGKTLKHTGDSEHTKHRIVYRADGLKHTLTIKDCAMEDEGEYTAMVGDDKCAAELIISEAPTDFTGQLRDQTITEFEDAEFTCKLSKEKAAVKWYKNGREIREGPRYHMEKEGKTCRLIIKVCRPDDECEYACGVDERRTRGGESNWVTTGEVLVKEQLVVPEVKIKLDGTLVVRAGDSFAVEAIVKGKPQPDVKWTKDETTEEIKKGPRLQLETGADFSKLLITGARRTDSGKYVVTASNSVGTSSAKCRINVLDRPGPIRDLKVSDITIDRCNLAWEVPEDDGGCDIYNYIIEKCETKRGVWSVHSNAVITNKAKV
uniref:Ig-like domain-containing protein n=1 Tax=Poecilia mexicana TaxID=48701 RepID=A0A3B3YDL6_9TELE